MEAERGVTDHAMNATEKFRLLLLNALACGLEICVAAGVTYVPPLLLEAGVEERYMTMVLGIGPVLALVFVPFISSASDNWSGGCGRRKPFILALSLGVVLGLLIVSYSASIAHHFQSEHAFKVGLMIVGVGLLDFCGQSCFTPLEALVADTLREPERCVHAYAMYSLMTSAGGCVGYLLPTVDWSGTDLARRLGGQGQCLFSILIAVFLVSLAVTMWQARDPPAPPAKAGGGQAAAAAAVALVPHGRAAGGHHPDVPLAGSVAAGAASGGGGRREVVEVVVVTQSGGARCCSGCVERAGAGWRAARHNGAAWWLRGGVVSFLVPDVYRSFLRMPNVLLRLCFAQLSSWMSIMTFMLFYTDFMGEGLYGGVPSAEAGSPRRLLYDEGVRMGSWGLFLQCCTSTVCSVGMDRLVTSLGGRGVYLASMGSFTIAMLVMCLSDSVALVTAMTALTGFGCSMLHTLPYTLTTLYHQEQEAFMFHKAKSDTDAQRSEKKPHGWESTALSAHAHKSHNGGPVLADRPSARTTTLPQQQQLQLPASQHATDHGKRGICMDMAILDSMLFLSQVVPSLCMGAIVETCGSVQAYVVCAAALGLASLYLGTRVVFTKADLEHIRHLL
ncbi:solute carrier family 45 member 3 [Lethenteron reissneri]|uniref:solute carrier family 45 member 3 n=1 Tax=Lethenteron reissneri TaxID=7753 RepID=UPI002AB7A8ED|nr:solute carrier family 45 member 3 [Lethenteron reissneri]XP_061422419.1 solute carrier family 45 member 3 [Lethenteron reissneri]